MMNTYDYEDSLFMIDPNLRELRDLKELYIQFNTRNSGKPMDARIELDELINYYLHCGNSIFVDFTNLLIRNHDYIINSFVMVEKHGSGKMYSSRLSNGPIESLNRKVKDLKSKRQIMRQSLNSTPPVMGGAASGIRPEDYLTMA